MTASPMRFFCVEGGSPSTSRLEDDFGGAVALLLDVKAP